MATTTELESRIRELEERLRQMEEDRSRWRARALVDELFPQESRKHMREAWKHNLMAVRSGLDHWIEKQDNGGKDDNEGPPHHQLRGGRTASAQSASVRISPKIRSPITPPISGRKPGSTASSRPARSWAVSSARGRGLETTSANFGARFARDSAIARPASESVCSFPRSA